MAGTTRARPVRHQGQGPYLYRGCGSGDNSKGEARNGNDNKGEARIQYNKGEARITATITKARPVIV